MAICANAILYRSTPVHPRRRRPSCSYPGARHRCTSAWDRPVARHSPGRGRSLQAEEQWGKRTRRIPPERPLLRIRQLLLRIRDRSPPTRSLARKISPTSTLSPLFPLFPLSPLSPLPAPWTRGAQPPLRPRLVPPELARRNTRLSCAARSLEWRVLPAMRVYRSKVLSYSCS
jgi:hypothetical protein